ncbi:MAG: helix-turn-helix domain-containing protein, partial [Candidatus Binatia bacterium]
MEKVSQTLRQAREQQNMTLEEAAQKTRIPLAYLMALEGKSPDPRYRTRLLPDPFYFIPHLRQYATFLDIDVNLVVTQFTNELQDIQQTNNKPASSNQSPQMLGPAPQRSRAISLSIILASVLVTLALIGQYSDLHTRAPSENEDRTVAPSDSPFEARPQATPLSPPITPPSASLESPQTVSAPVQPSSSSQQSNAPSQTSTSSAPPPSASTTPSSPSDSAHVQTSQSGTVSPAVATALVEPTAGRP